MDTKSLEHLHQMVDRIFTAMKIPDKIVIDDGHLIVNGLWATTGEITETRQTFAGLRKVTTRGFIIGTVAHSPATRSEPEDAQPIEQGQYSNALRAAEALARLWWDDQLAQVMEKISYELVG